jgi:glutathione S-transferase
MNLEFYWGSGSTYAWRVLLALEHKGMAFESRLLSFSARDHKAPEFLAVNPRGQVPAISHGEFTLHESLAILWYIDCLQPEPPLFGTGAQQSARVLEFVCEFQSHWQNRLDRVSRPIFTGELAHKEADVRAALDELSSEFSILEDEARAADWLAGTAGPSAADFVFYPGIAQLRRALGKPAAAGINAALTPFAESFPAMERWRARVEALPYFKRTWPPHWTD